MKNTDGIPIPDITVSVWKELNTEESVYDSCLYKDGATIETCIETTKKNLPKLDSIVFGSKRSKSIDLTNVSLHEDFTHVRTGISVTFNIPFNIGPEDDEQLYILLDPEFEYQISVHDPKFFLFTENAAFLPLMKHHTSGFYYPIELTEMLELDTPDDPCNSDEDYNFHECIRKSVARQVLKEKDARLLNLKLFVIKLKLFRLTVRPNGTCGVQMTCYPATEWQNLPNNQLFPKN